MEAIVAAGRATRLYGCASCRPYPGFEDLSRQGYCRTRWKDLFQRGHHRVGPCSRPQLSCTHTLDLFEYGV